MCRTRGYYKKFSGFGNGFTAQLIPLHFSSLWSKPWQQGEHLNLFGRLGLIELFWREIEKSLFRPWRLVSDLSLSQIGHLTIDILYLASHFTALKLDTVRFGHVSKIQRAQWKNLLDTSLVLKFFDVRIYCKKVVNSLTSKGSHSCLQVGFVSCQIMSTRLYRLTQIRHV